MIIRLFLNGIVALLLMPVLSACHRSAPAPPPVETVARVDWAGSSRVAANTNAAALFEILTLPESVKLRDQTLDKLAQVPWTRRAVPTDTNAAVLLRPLLEDLLQLGGRVEWAGRSNQAPAWAVGVQLNTERAQLWETNLFQVAEALTGQRPLLLTGKRSGWKAAAGSSKEQGVADLLAQTNASPAWPAFVGWVRRGVGVGGGAGPDQTTFELVAERLLAPETAAVSNQWLGAVLDLPKLQRYLSWLSLVQDTLPVVQVTIGGENGKVRTEAVMDFPQALPLTSGEWQVPTNLIDQPLAAFSAVRGLDGWLSNSPAWRKLDLGAAPDQMFVWGFQRQYMYSYFAAHHANPSNLVSRATDKIMPGGQEWLREDWTAGFKKSAEGKGVEWAGLPYLYPFLRTAPTNGDEFVLGGAFAFPEVSSPLTPEFYETALAPQDLLYYGWEMSGQRVAQWLFMGQFARYASVAAQLPPESASVLWLKALESKLGDSVTRITRTQPNQLTLVRSSSLGLTAIELHLLGDWLESPAFPRGLHTSEVPPPPPTEE
jgi:hypothetical protein